MTNVLLLAIAGILSLLAGGLIVLFAPGRFASLLAGCGLALLGVLQIGFARVALDVPWGGDVLWFRYSLALALPVTLLWVLTAATLGRPRSIRLGASWRAYLLLQAFLAAAGAAWLGLGPAPAPALDRGVISLGTPERVILGIILVNIVLYTVRFEATYLSLPRRYRRAFRPALLGIVVCSAFFAILAVNGLLSGRAVVEDLAFGAAPVSLMALLAPLSYVRGRLGEARLSPSVHPVTATTSFLLAAAFLAGTAVLLWMTHSMGVSLLRGLWLLAVGGVILGITALAVSNRARRRVERALAPLFHDWGGAYRLAAVRAVAPLDGCASLDELCRSIPSNASELADVDPVTLFVAHRASAMFRSVSSTLNPRPDAEVADRDPLTVELRRARRPIRLQGRADDLEYVSIYIENKAAISACAARVAVPLFGEEELIAFLLCGPRRDGSRPLRDVVRLLHFASKRYAMLLERELIRETRSKPNEGGR